MNRPRNIYQLTHESGNKMRRCNSPPTSQESGSDFVPTFLCLGHDFVPRRGGWLLTAKEQLKPVSYQKAQPRDLAVKYPLIPGQARAFLQGVN
jgi:hypothetical protein